MKKEPEKFIDRIRLQSITNSIYFKEDPKVLNNVETITWAAKYDEGVLTRVSDEIKDNEEIMKGIIEENPLAFKYAGPNIKNNLEIAEIAINGEIKLYEEGQIDRIELFSSAGSEVRDNIDIAQKVFKAEPESYRVESPDLDEDDDPLYVTYEPPTSFRNAGPTVKNDAESVLMVIEKNPEMFQYAGPKATFEILEQDMKYAKYINPELKESIEQEINSEKNSTSLQEYKDLMETYGFECKITEKEVLTFDKGNLFGTLEIDSKGNAECEINELKNRNIKPIYESEDINITELRQELDKTFSTVDKSKDLDKHMDLDND